MELSEILQLEENAEAVRKALANLSSPGLPDN